ALLASGWVARDIEPAALPHYLSAFVVADPYTFFRGVRRLPAGHQLTVDAAGARETRYWDCAFEEEPDAGRAAYREEVRELLEDAVRRRLVSDVPLGSFISGGIDSGMVTTVAARASSEPLRTFTLGFEGSAQDNDERPAARRPARSRPRPRPARRRPRPAPGRAGGHGPRREGDPLAAAPDRRGHPRRPHRSLPPRRARPGRARPAPGGALRAGPGAPPARPPPLRLHEDLSSRRAAADAGLDEHGGVAGGPRAAG